jgi:hypothetical protein
MTDAPRLTKWGTTVPDGYTVEQYERMIEETQERASAFSAQVKAKQAEQAKADRERRSQIEKQQRVLRGAVLDIVEEKTRQFSETLLRKRRQMRFPDDYGMNDEQWVNEKGVFAKRILLPVLTKELEELGYRRYYPNVFTDLDSVLFELIDNVLDFVDAESGGKEDVLAVPDQSSAISGVEYEHLCRQLLEKSGWQVTMTPATADQGADLIALKGTIRIAVQCKRYNAPVGNSAVQEVVAAKHYYEADVALGSGPINFG